MSERQKISTKARKISAQDEFSTNKMDQFIEELYKVEKAQMLEFIQGYIVEHGEDLINLRDSTGNCLIHHICTYLNEDEVQLMTDLLLYLLSSSKEKEELKEDESLACMNFLRGLPISLQYTKESLNELGIDTSKKGITKILQINSGNSFGQSPLHILASQRKSKLLLKFLELVYEGSPELLGFNPNVQESTNRTFIHILLEKQMIDTYEQIAKIYQGQLDLKQKDLFSNSALMTYKTLKRNQIDKLKQERKYSQLVDEILVADLNAFGDVRNLIFDRELGTSILTDLIRKDSGDDFIALLKELLTKVLDKNQMFLNMLVNMPNKSGQSMTLEVFHKLKFSQIKAFIDMVGANTIRYIENTNNKVNILHCLMGNLNLNSKEKKELSDIANHYELSNSIDFIGNIPLNYFIQSISQNANNEDMDVFKYFLSHVDLTIFQDPIKIQQSYQENQQSLTELERLRKQKSQMDERFKGKSPNMIKKVKKLSVKNQKDKLDNAKTYNEFLQKSRQPINPLEIAIKRNLKEYNKVLIKDYNISPWSMSSNNNGSLIEIGIEYSDFEIFKLAIDQINHDTLQFIQFPLKTALLIFNSNSALQEDKNKVFIKLYSEFLDKIFQQDIETLLNSEFQKSEQGDEIISMESLKKILHFEDDSQKSKLNVDTLEVLLKKIIHPSQLMLLASKTKNYQFISKLKDHIKFEDADLSDYFYYKMFKEQAQRNDSQGIRELLKSLPQIQEALKKSKRYRQKIGKAMFNSFKDIYDPQCVHILRQEFGIIIIPEGQGTNKKSQYDRRFQQLSQGEQKRLIYENQAESFKHIIELVNNSNKNDGCDIDFLNSVFSQKEKYQKQYLRKLVESKIFFKVIDVRVPFYQSIVANFVRTCAKLGHLDIIIALFEQLKSFLKENTSLYPLDYYAEVYHHEYKYPYRKNKIKQFVRMINLKNDQYPIFHGQLDTQEISDDTELDFYDIWDEMIASKDTIKSKIPGVQDFYVPNANALLFLMFTQDKSTQLCVDQNNYEQVMIILNYIYEFGGFPLIEITNLKNNTTLQENQLQNLERKNKILQKFNESLRSGKFQIILHQMALSPECDKELIKALCQNSSIIQQSFNSRDSTGKTPIMLGIEHRNIAFLETAIQYNPSIYIQDDQSFQNVIQTTFQHATIHEKIQILKCIALNIKNIGEKQKQLLIQNNQQHLNKLLDSLYDFKSDDELDQKRAKLVLELIKLRRQQLNHLIEKKDLNAVILYGKTMSNSFNNGSLITQLAGEMTIEQFKELEYYGYDICNYVCPCIQNAKYLEMKIPQVPQYFPFKSLSHHISYALKYVLLKQQNNKELISYIFSRMDMTHYKPFLFEIMVIIGKVMGTKNEMFQRLFNKEKAYLMGRYLTIEKRIRTFNEAYVPNVVTLYYLEDSYSQMLITLMDILIENNEQQMFNQMINDQARFYLCKDMIVKGLESCCRNFKPKLALLLVSIGLREDLSNNFIDMANLLPELNSNVTLKDVQQTALIVRSLDKYWSAKKFFKKISREMMDELISHILENQQLYLIFDLKDKETKQEQTKILQEIYHKSSLKNIGPLLEQLRQQCTDDKTNQRLDKMLLSLPGSAYQSVTKTSFSNHYKSYKRAEMKNYLMNKIDSFASDENHFKIITDSQNAKQLTQILGITEQDLYQIRDEIIKTHDENIKLDNKEFIYGEFQTLLGVYKVHSQNKRPNRKQDFFKLKFVSSQTDSVSELQNMSLQEIKNLNREQLKTKSENLILLYEYLMRQENRRNLSNHSKDNRSATISDQELRELIFSSQPTALNIGSLFSTYDTFIIYNEIEDILAKQKWAQVIKEIDLNRYNDQDKLQKLLTKLTHNSLNSADIKYLLIVFDYYITIQKKRQNILIQMVHNRQGIEGAENPEEEVKILLALARHDIDEKIEKAFKNTTNEYIKSQLLHLISDFLQVDEFIELFKITFSDEDHDSAYGQLLQKILITQAFYQHLSKSFYEPLIDAVIKGKFNFVYEDSYNIMQKEHFYKLFLPVFIYDSQEYQHKLLSSAPFMEHMSPLVKQLIFAVLASKPQQIKFADEHLEMMVPYMQQEQDLAGILHNTIFQNNRTFAPNTLKYQNPLIKITIQNEARTITSTLSYLVKCKRFKVLKIYAQGLELNDDFIIVLLQFGYKEKELVKHFLNIHKLDLENYARLFSWLLINTSEDFVQFMDGFYDNKLLQTEIIYIQNLPQERGENFIEMSFDSILHELIHQKYYEQIKMVKKLATPEQWKYLKELSRPLNEIEITEDDQVTPFYLALEHNQFDLCEILMPNDEYLNFLTLQELECVKRYLTESNTTSFSQIGPKREQLIYRFQEAFFSKNKPKLKVSKDKKNSEKTIIDYQLTKRILIFPQILKFIFKANSKEGLDLKAIAQELAKKEQWLNAEIDVFLLKCGFSFDTQRFILSSDKSATYILYVLEKGFELEKFFQEINPNCRSQFATHPYTQLNKAGLIDKQEQFNQEILETNDLKSVISEIQEEISQVNKGHLSEIFNEETFDKLIKQGLPQNFIFSYYILVLQKNFNIIPNLDIKDLNNIYWNLHYESFAHDMIIITQIKQLFGQESLFKAFIDVKREESYYGYIFYDDKHENEGQSIACNFNARQMALLLTVLNGFDNYQFELYKDIEETEEKKEQNYWSKIVIQEYLKESQNYVKASNKKKLSLEPMIQQLRLLKEGIEQYESVFGNQNSDYYKLAEKLDIQVDQHLLMQKLSDKELQDIITDLININGQTYQDYFKMKFDFDPYNLDHNGKGRYPQSLRLCEFIANDIEQYLRKMSGYLYQDAFINFKFTKSDKNEFEYVDKTTFNCTVGFSVIKDEYKISDLAQKMKYKLNQNKIREFLQKSVEQLKQKLKVKEVTIADSTLIDQLTLQECQTAVDILGKRKSYNIKDSLYDLVAEKLLTFLKEKRLFEIEFKEFVISLVTKEQLFQDQQENYDLYLEQAVNANSSEDLTIPLMFAFDFTEKQHQIILNEAALLPYVFLANKVLVKDLLTNHKFYQLDQSKFYEIPQVNINLVSLYKNVIKKIQGFFNPYSVASHFISNNHSLLNALITSIDNLADEYRVMMGENIQKNVEKRIKHATYNKLANIEILFDFDEPQKQVKSIQEDQLMYVTDVSYSTREIADVKSNNDNTQQEGASNADISKVQDQEEERVKYDEVKEQEPEEEKKEENEEIKKILQFHQEDDIWNGTQRRRRRNINDNFKYPSDKNTLEGIITLKITIVNDVKTIK